MKKKPKEKTRRKENSMAEAIKAEVIRLIKKFTSLLVYNVPYWLVYMSCKNVLQSTRKNCTNK